MYTKCKKDYCKEKRMDLLSSSIVDGSPDNRFKTQQERLENKTDKDRREVWLGGCAVSNLRPFKKSWAPWVRAGAGRLALGQRVDSITFHGPCQQHDSMNVSFL